MGVLLGRREVDVASGGCVGTNADLVNWKMAVCAANVPAADTGFVGVGAEAPGMLHASTVEKMARMEIRMADLRRVGYDVIPTSFG
jgi:hypothetical protein